jgi:hypothetical protein
MSHERVTFPLGEWEAEVAYCRPDAFIVGIRLTKTTVENVRLDIGKGVFLDPPLWGNSRPSDVELRALFEHIRILQMEENERQRYEEHKKLVDERDALRLEIEQLRNALASESSYVPSYAPPEPTCFGGCSRGGSGPACGKRGCRG